MSIRHPQAISDLDQTIHGRFEEMASIYPDNIALKFNDRSLTYSQLSQKSTHLAAEMIRHAGSGPGQVAIYLEHGIDQPLAILACLKAGKTYVALDPSFPAERNLLMLDDAGCELMLTNHMNISQVRSFKRDKGIINIDDEFDQDTTSTSFPEADPQRYAFITYTSGSTGIPKGVPHRHINMIHFIKRMYQIDCTMPDDIWGYYYSLSFSAHAMSIFSALLNGATLSIFDLKKDNFTEFGKWLRQEKISTCLMIPSVLRQFTATLGTGRRFPKLSKLLIGGETLYRSDIEKIKEHLKADAQIFNIYASSEAYLARAYRIGEGTLIKGNIVPIGYAIEDIEIIVESEKDVPCQQGKTGEMCVRSKYIADSYWGREQNGNDDFSTDSEGHISFRSKDLGYMMPDGCLVHVGRKDSVVKLRGYRIDMGEIENTLIELKQVKEVAVMVKEDLFGNKHIVAYYVERDNADLDPHYLKVATLRNLPDYMVPSFFLRLGHLPKNEIGKVDYRQFPEPDWNSMEKKKDIELPENPLEEELKEIFERTLNVTPLGVTENIMDSGADSLKLFVAFDEIEKRFGVKLNLDSVLGSPRIRDIAKLLNDQENQIKDERKQ